MMEKSDTVLVFISPHPICMDGEQTELHCNIPEELEQVKAGDK